MSKMNELSMLLDKVITTGTCFLEALAAVKELILAFDTPVSNIKEIPTAAIPEKTYSLEDVRVILSGKSNSNNGRYRNEVKNLVKKYSNGGTLKDVPTEKYAELVAEVEAIDV